MWHVYFKRQPSDYHIFFLCGGTPTAETAVGFNQLTASVLLTPKTITAGVSGTVGANDQSVEFTVEVDHAALLAESVFIICLDFIVK